LALFTDAQIRQLARHLIDDHGSSLDQDTLVEQIGLMLEDVAGCEPPSDANVQTAINRIRSTYHDLTSQDRTDRSRQDQPENGE
jgi:hypothetical protein